MPLVQPEREPQHVASSALLLWTIATVLFVTPSIGLVLLGLRGVTLLAAATVGAGIAFGVVYLKYSEVVLYWLENRTQLRMTLEELEQRARALEEMSSRRTPMVRPHASARLREEESA